MPWQFTTVHAQSVYPECAHLYIAKRNVIFCNLCDQINGKCVDKIVSAADFAMYNSNSKCPAQISSYDTHVGCQYAYGLPICIWDSPYAYGQNTCMGRNS